MLTKRLFSSSSASPNLFKIGSILKQTRTFTDADVLGYSELTHDANPLHFDAECAKDAGFNDRLVPGMLVASLFPRIIAAHFVSFGLFKSCFLVSDFSRFVLRVDSLI
ncbi:AP2 domain-containing transcription factor [Capsicum annuum]|nr:AP2 domain-containing transcription factor [Capsicum annuum]